MPASARASLPEQLTAMLSAEENGDSLLQALREIKNQIIGNRTKKLVYLRLSAVPRIVSLLSQSSSSPAVLVQAAASVGSFACGVEEGVRAVIEAGAVSDLTRLLSHQDVKVVNAAARSLKIIYQSKIAPKYNILLDKNLEFLLSLLNSENENLTELAASIIAHSCETETEQATLCNAEALQRLAGLLCGLTNQRDSFLDATLAIIKKNSDTTSRFARIGNGKAFNSLIGLTKDRNPRTRLLACMCLIEIGLECPSYFSETRIRTKVMLVLLELLEDSGRVGEEAPLLLRKLIGESEEMQRQAVSVNTPEKLCSYLRKSSIGARRLEGVLLALAQVCSKLEESRSLLLELQRLSFVVDVLKHDSPDVRIAACHFIKNMSRSLKNLCAGRFSNESIVIPLIQLLHDPSTSMQIAALGAICNVAVNLTSKKSILLHCGGVPQLVQLTKSMHSEVRLKSVWALKNLMFLADTKEKDYILSELTVPTLLSLICDVEHPIQEQALALVSNFIDGYGDSIKHVFAKNNSILDAVSRQLYRGCSSGVYLQGMIVLTNLAAGTDSHKDAVMNIIIPCHTEESSRPSFVIKFLQSKEKQLRVATLWCLHNLVYPERRNSLARIAAFHEAGIISQVKAMVNDPCTECKLRVRMVLDLCLDLENNRHDHWF